MYEMKPEYLTGIELIDEEHKQLFMYADEAYELLHEEFIADKYDRVSDILTKLSDYAKQHFADEEAYMESIQYKRLFTQKIQHQQFIEKLEELDMSHLEDADNQDELIMNILDFIMDWLINHILHVDGLIGK